MTPSQLALSCSPGQALAIAKLPARHRKVAIAVLCTRMPHYEIAAAVGLDPFTFNMLTLGLHTVGMRKRRKILKAIEKWEEGQAKP